MTQHRPCRTRCRGSAELLAEDGVGGTLAREARTDERLDGAVGVADRGEVGLGVDDEVGGAEASGGDGVGGVRELECQRQVGHVRAGYRRRT